jgi:PTH2 family peptidyl-tRNA hydrolase
MYKQVIIARSDLKLSKGKLAAQCCHACYEASRRADKKTSRAWENEGQKKIVLQAASLKDLIDIKIKAEKAKLPVAMISDAGLTELNPGTITCIAIGPDREENINKITGSLKLLK